MTDEGVLCHNFGSDVKAPVASPTHTRTGPRAHALGYPRGRSARGPPRPPGSFRPCSPTSGQAGLSPHPAAPSNSGQFPKRQVHYPRPRSLGRHGLRKPPCAAPTGPGGGRRRQSRGRRRRSGPHAEPRVEAAMTPTACPSTPRSRRTATLGHTPAGQAAHGAAAGRRPPDAAPEKPGVAVVRPLWSSAALLTKTPESQGSMTLPSLPGPPEDVFIEIGEWRII